MVNKIELSSDDDEYGRKDYSLSKLSDVSLGKVTMRQKKRKKSPYKPNVSMVIDVTENDPSDDTTPEDLPQRLYDESINVSSDECDQKIEKYMATPERKRKTLNEYNTNEPKINLNIPSIPVDSDCSIDEPNNVNKPLNHVVVSEGSSDEEGFIFTTPKKALTSPSKSMVMNNKMSDDNPSCRKQRSKQKTQKKIPTSVKKSDSKVHKPVENPNSLDSPAHRVNRDLFRELPKVCTEPDSLPEERLVGVLENPDELQTKKKKHKNKIKNTSNVEEQQNKEKPHEPEVKSKNELNKKSKFEKEPPTQSKKMKKASKSHCSNDYENMSGDRNVSNIKTQHVTSNSPMLTKTFKPHKVLEGKQDTSKPTIVSKEKHPINNNPTKRNSVKKKKLDEIELIQAQILKKVLNDMKTKSNKLDHENNDIHCYSNEGSSKTILDIKPTSPLAVKQQKKNSKKKKPNKIDDMAGKLLSKALKDFESPTKPHSHKLKSPFNTKNSKISPSKSIKNLPSSISGPSSIQSTLKNDLHLLPINPIPLLTKVKSINYKSVSKDREKFNLSTEKMYTSDSVDQNTNDNVDARSKNSQDLPKVKKKKRNNSEKETISTEKEKSETISNEGKLPPSNIVEEASNVESNRQVVSKSAKKKRKHSEKKENDEEINQVDLGPLPTKVKSKKLKSKSKDREKFYPSTENMYPSDSVDQSTKDNVDTRSKNSQDLPKIKKKKRHNSEKETISNEGKLPPSNIVEDASNVEPNLQVVSKSVKKKRKHSKKKENDEEINQVDLRVPTAKKKKKTKDKVDFDVMARNMVADMLTSRKPTK